jgi:ssDNA-binding Zn-finger/Zn-ribbon topoisomerase 1
VPRCPYKMCPGVFNTCGASLHWRELGNSGNGFWGCCLYPQCEFRWGATCSRQQHLHSQACLLQQMWEATWHGSGLRLLAIISAVCLPKQL